MDTIKISNKKNTLFVAHRGLSGIEKENTVNAYVAACNRSYYGVECDIRVTADGKYIIHHDHKSGRLCKTDLEIEKTKFEVLRNLKFKVSASELEILKMPTPEEYFSVISKYGKFAVIELKKAWSEKNIAEIIDICESCYSSDKIIYIAFDLINLINVRKLRPLQSVQFLTCEVNDEIINTLAQKKMDVDVDHIKLTKELVEKFHAHGIKVNCWTCDDPDRARELVDWGVDYITTNILE